MVRTPLCLPTLQPITAWIRSPDSLLMVEVEISCMVATQTGGVKVTATDISSGYGFESAYFALRSGV